MAENKKITLVVVPCWWDGSKESLEATIHFQRPELIPTPVAVPIPLNPPTGYFKISEVPDVGELMLPSFPMETYFDVSQHTWWIGEKYDGLRCCWNPRLSRLYTRTGNQLHILPEFTSLLPSIFIDCELWFGRGMYSSAIMLSAGSLEFKSWDLLRLISFDVPSSVSAKSQPFEMRYKTLLQHLKIHHSFAVVASRFLCSNNKSLKKFVQKIIEEGGEGVILRKFRSLYEHGRSSNLIKLKTSFGDAEGIVVAKEDDGSVQLKLPDRRTFTVSTSHMRIPPSAIRAGDVVTFSYERCSRRELPVNPVIERVRSDLSWEDVVHSYVKEDKFLTELSRIPGYTSKPQRYWTTKNMKLLMENYGKQRNLDPSLASTWSTITHKDISQLKHGNSVLTKLKGYHGTLANLFPNLKFEDSSLVKIENRRKFFEDYAKMFDFDPQQAENWYSQPMALIMSTKGANNVIYHHSNSLTQALLDIFPNIGLDKSKLWNKDVWRNKLARRRFFESYARANGFDPLSAEHWYKQRRLKVVGFKGLYKVISYHNNDYSQALVDLFPDVKWEKSQIGRPSWRTKELRRKFFETYAKVNKFNPLIPENWYNQPRSKIVAFKRATSVLSHYNNNVAFALTDLFPDIVLEKSKFNWRQKKDRTS